MSITRFFKLGIFISIFFSITSCDDNELSIPINEPENYVFLRDGSSTVSYSGQSTRIAMAEELIIAVVDPSISLTMMQEMFANENSSGNDVNPFSTDELNASTKSIRSKVAASNDYFSSNATESAIIKQMLDQYITAQVNEVFPRWNELASKGMAGQIADGTSTRYVNAKGLEYNQALAKSLIGALMTDQILNNYLSTEVLYASTNIADNTNAITLEGKNYTNLEHYWDEAYGYLYGAATDGTNPLATTGGDDSFLNKYLGRVEGDSDFTGISANIYDAFKLGRAAIVANNLEVVEDQIAILRKEISKIIGIRAVYYLQKGKLNLSNGNTGSAFHDLSEGFGFITSLRFTRSTDGSPLFTRQEVDSYIDQLMTGDGFWDLSGSVLDNLSNQIASKFDFTVDQAGS